MKSGRVKPGPSNAYRRLLAGKITPERYVAIVKRSVQKNHCGRTLRDATGGSHDQKGGDQRHEG